MQIEPGSDGLWGGSKREASSLEAEQGGPLICATEWCGGSHALSPRSLGKTTAS